MYALGVRESLSRSFLGQFLRLFFLLPKGFEALGACGRFDGCHQQAPARLGTAAGGYMVGGAHE